MHHTFYLVIFLAIISKHALIYIEWKIANLAKYSTEAFSSKKNPRLNPKNIRPGNLASLGKQFMVTVFVHLAETMKQIFVSLSRYWQKRYVNDGN